MRTTIRSKCAISSKKTHKPTLVADTIIKIDSMPRLKEPYHALAVDVAKTVNLYIQDEFARAEITGAYLLKLGYELAKNDVDILKS